MKAWLERALWVLALGFVVFFGAWRQQGLQPDAALYAGLARRILSSHEEWRLAGTPGFFPIFFEHPPFFIQWGASVLSWLGTSDGAARAMGGIPGLLGFLLTCAWTARRFGSSAALWTAFALATFGHYTKFAATSMMEAPLSLGVVLAAIGIFESLWGARAWGMAALIAGTALATIAKGVAGLGAFGGVALTCPGAIAWDRSQRSMRALGFAGLTLVVALVAALAPLAYWVWKMASLEGLEWIAGYFVDQVGGSAATTRGDLTHAGGGDKLFYVRMILLNGWPWWWTVPAALVALARGWISSLEAKRWALVALSFGAAFVIPFSLVQFQLAHYIHPIYLVFAPLAGLFLSWVVSRFEILSRLPAPKLRWRALAIVTCAVLLSAHGASRTQNRGQPFLRASPAVTALRSECPVVVSASFMDPYRMEAYGLWYWQGHPWRVVSSPEERPTSGADWNPDKPELLKPFGSCAK